MTKKQSTIGLKQKSPIIGYLLCSLAIAGIMIVLNLSCIIFIGVPAVVQVIFGIIFMAISGILFFVIGKSRGEKYFKNKVASVSIAHGVAVNHAIDVNYFSSVFNVLLFAIIPIILTPIAVGLNNTILHSVIFFIFFPASLFFNSEIINIIVIAI